MGLTWVLAYGVTSCLLWLYLLLSQWTEASNTNYKVIVSSHFPCFQHYLMCLTGFQDVQVDHYETMEAVVGQKISLPCIVQSISNFKIVSIEWSKKGTIPLKLALLSPKYGSNNFSSDSTLAIINNDAGELMGTYLELHNVNKGHAGTYICELSTFPFGALKKETELRIDQRWEELKAPHFIDADVWWEPTPLP